MFKLDTSTDGNYIVAEADGTSLIITSNILKQLKDYGIDKALEECRKLEGYKDKYWCGTEPLTEDSIILVNGDVELNVGDISPTDIDKMEFVNSLCKELDDLNLESPVCDRTLFGPAFMLLLIDCAPDGDTNGASIITWLNNISDTVSTYVCDCQDGLTPLEVSDFEVLIDDCVYKAFQNVVDNM